MNVTFRVDKDTLYIALFFELENVIIKDLTIENLLIDVETTLKDINSIVIAPLAIVANNVTLDNVNIIGNIKYSKLPDKEINFNVVNDGYFVYSKDNTITDSTIEVTESNR